MSYKVVIVEDDEMAMDELAFNIKNNDPENEFELVGKAGNGKKAKAVILKEKPDLLFLDIQLPDMKGMDLLEEIREKINWKMFTIFYTGHPNYMLDAIRQSAFDFLGKGFEQPELLCMLERFKKEYEKAIHTENRNEDPLPTGVADNTQNTYILINLGHVKQKFHIDKIVFFEHDKTQKRWQVYLSDRPEPIPLKKNIENGANKILSYCPGLLAKISQSCIINLHYLQYIDGSKCILYPPFEKRYLPISGPYKKDLQDKFFNP